MANSWQKAGGKEMLVGAIITFDVTSLPGKTGSDVMSLYDSLAIWLFLE